VSTLWKPPLSTSVETSAAAIGTLTYRLTPASSRLAATPANSAHVVPRLASMSASSAGAAQRTP